VVQDILPVQPLSQAGTLFIVKQLIVMISSVTMATKVQWIPCTKAASSCLAVQCL